MNLHVDEDQGKRGKSTVFGASFNFINSIVGAGIIGMSFAIKQCGFYSGVFAILFVAWLNNRSAVMLIDCGIQKKCLDYELLSEISLGRRGYYFTLAAMMTFAYGGQVAYLILVGDTVPLIGAIFCPGTLLANRNVVLVAASTFIILPLCLMRDLSSLACTSFLSILAVTVLVSIVLATAPNSARSQEIHTTELQFVAEGLFAGIGTLSFAFVCQHNAFMVFRSLAIPTVENWSKVALYSVSVALCLCLVLGISGYTSFYDSTQADILNSFAKTGAYRCNVTLSLLDAMLFL